MPETHSVAPSLNRKHRRPRRLRPLLVGAPEAAELLGLSVATFYRRCSAGEIGPQAVKLGGRRLFKLSELRRWTESGCPDRETWLEMEAQSKNSRD